MANAGIQGLFWGMDAATLATMQTQWQACLAAIATAGQSYSIAGRTFSRANLAEVAQMLAEVNSALQRANGSRTTQTYGYFTGDYPGCSTNGS